MFLTMSSPVRSIPVALLATYVVLRSMPALAAPAPAAAPAALPASPCGRLSVAPVVQVPVGKSVVLRPDTAIARILLGNPENAQAARPAEGAEVRKGEGAKAPAAESRPGVANVDVLLLGPREPRQGTRVAGNLDPVDDGDGDRRGNGYGQHRHQHADIEAF